jgi:glutaredoxin
MSGIVIQSVRRPLLLTVAAVALFLGVARADTVVLNNRVIYKGAIIAETKEEVTIQSDGMQWTFKRDKVASVTREKATADQEFCSASKRRKSLEQATRTQALEQAARREAQEQAAYAQSAEQASHPQAPQQVVRSQAAGSQVIVYGTSWCGWCRKAREFFAGRHVPYIEKDIEADALANSEVKEKCARAGMSSRGVPIVDVYGTIIHGYDENGFNRALASRR